MRVRHIITRHLLRRTARASAEEFKRLQVKGKAGDMTARVLLKEHGIRLDDRVEAERAGRIRARWVVCAGPKAQ